MSRLHTTLSSLCLLLSLAGCSENLVTYRDGGTSDDSHAAADGDRQRDGTADLARADASRTDGLIPQPDGALADITKPTDVGGAPCDPQTFKTSCSAGSLITSCVQGKTVTVDCKRSLNPHCVAGSGDCLASSDTSACAYGKLPACASNGGQPAALSCSQVGGSFRSYYATCPPASVGGSASCQAQPNGSGLCLSGPACTEKDRKCQSSTVLHYCTVNGLAQTDCAKRQQVCLTSSLGNGYAACHNSGETPCDPTTFVDKCLSATIAVSCSAKIGYTTTLDCGALGKRCCFNIDAGLAVGNLCC